MMTPTAALLVYLLFLTPSGLSYLLIGNRMFDHPVEYALTGWGAYLVIGTATVLCRHRPRLYDKLIYALAMMLLGNAAGCFMILPSP